MPAKTESRGAGDDGLDPKNHDFLLIKATELLEGDTAAARDWLSRPCKALGNLSPLAAAETEIGARAVEDLIGRLEHGAFS